MLPRRIPKAPKRASRWRSQAHCNFVRSHNCCVPGCLARPIEVAHVRRAFNSGVGVKPSDRWTISLCRDHHSEQHRGDQTFEAKYGIDCLALSIEFMKASPHRIKLETMP